MQWHANDQTPLLVGLFLLPASLAESHHVPARFLPLPACCFVGYLLRSQWLKFKLDEYLLKPKEHSF